MLSLSLYLSLLISFNSINVHWSAEEVMTNFCKTLVLLRLQSSAFNIPILLSKLVFFFPETSINHAQTVWTITGITKISFIVFYYVYSSMSFNSIPCYRFLQLLTILRTRNYFIPSSMKRYKETLRQKNRTVDYETLYAQFRFQWMTNRK